MSTASEKLVSLETLFKKHNWKKSLEWFSVHENIHRDVNSDAIIDKLALKIKFMFLLIIIYKRQNIHFKF